MFMKKVSAALAFVGAVVGTSSIVGAQTLGTAVSDATTAMNADVVLWIPGIFGIIALGILVALGAKFLGFTRKG